MIYQLMQLSPATLRNKIREAHGATRRQLIQALWLRDVCLLAFAIGYIALFATLFGTANSVVGVASFCMLLSLRSVDYGYRCKDSVLAIGVILTIMTLNSVLAFIVPVGLSFWIHFIGLLVILRLTSQHPEYGNGGVYTFSYVLLIGTSVAGVWLRLRLVAIALAWLFCAGVLWQHHRTKNATVQVWQVFKPIDVHVAVDRWQLRLALGVALALAVSNTWAMMRPMWCGFAAMSALLPFQKALPKRMLTRLAGVVIGASLFAGLVMVLPHALVFLLAPLAGFGLGLTGSYFAASILNCFGALSIAYTVYGVTAASSLRILDNGLGLLVALIFAWGCRLLWQRHTCQRCDVQ